MAMLRLQSVPDRWVRLLGHDLGPGPDVAWLYHPTDELVGVLGIALKGRAVALVGNGGKAKRFFFDAPPLAAEFDQVMVGVGVLAGLALSIAGAGLVAGILVDVNARDPIVYTTITALLLGIAAMANYLPARRAAALNPSNALRL